jgi:hypothetical protein
MATLRERPFVSKPSDALKARMEQARQGGFFVVQTPGPTSFVLKSDQESKKLKDRLEEMAYKVNGLTTAL